MHFAAANGHEDVIQVLLTFNADIDFSRKKGNSPLHIAVKYNYIDVAGFLLDKDAKVNKANMDGQTSLHIAARMGNKAMVDLLTKKGAKLKKIDNNDEIPLFIAIRAANTEVIDKLLEGFKMTTTNRKRQTALHLACVSGSTEIARKLVDYGADLDVRDVFGNTPLHYATMGDWSEIVNVLLIHKADATIRNAKGKSPFFYASVEVAKLFRQHFQADGALDSLAAAVQKQATTKTQTPRPRRVPRSHPSMSQPMTPQNKTQRQHSPDTSGSSMFSPTREYMSDNREPNKEKMSYPAKSLPASPPPRRGQEFISTEDFEQFKAEMRLELDQLTQKMNQMINELKQQKMVPQQIISPKK